MEEKCEQRREIDINNVNENEAPAKERLNQNIPPTGTQISTGPLK